MVLGIGGFSEGKAGGPVYEIEVNEGSVNMRHFTKVANQRAANGYRMAHVYSPQHDCRVGARQPLRGMSCHRSWHVWRRINGVADDLSSA